MKEYRMADCPPCESFCARTTGTSGARSVERSRSQRRRRLTLGDRAPSAILRVSAVGFLSSLLKVQTTPDRLNNPARAQRNIDLHACCGFLKRGELAIEQIGLHEMAAAFAEPLLDNFIAPLEINQNDPFIDQQKLAVTFLQGGAGENGRIAAFKTGADQDVKRLQPRPSVGVIQRDPAPHLFDVGARMEVVTFVILPTEFLGKPSSNCRFAGTAHTH
jgi:hypothetical protein